MIEPCLVFVKWSSDFSEAELWLIITVSEASKLVTRLRRLYVKYIGAKLVARSLIQTPINESAKVILCSHFH